MLESCVDGCECLAMGDVLINLHVAGNIVVHQAGKLRATFDATKSTTLPHTPGHKLKCCLRFVSLSHIRLGLVEEKRGRKNKFTLTSGRYLLASGSNANDNTLTPSLVARFKGSTHDTHISSAIKGVVTPAVCHVDKLFLDGLSAEFGGVHKIGGSELVGLSRLVVVHVNDNDLVGFVLHCALNDRQSNTSRTEDGDVGAFFDIGGDGRCAVTGGNTTSQ